MRNILILLPLLAIISGCIVEKSDKSANDKKETSAAAGSATPSTPNGGEALKQKLAQINQAALAPVAVPTAPPAGTGIKSASATPAAAETPPSPFIVRAEVLLARVRFSPGVVDGQFGTNFKHAVAAYQKAHDLPASGTIDDQTWQALSGAPASGPTGAPPPVAQDYTLAAADVAGPYAADVGEDFVKLAALPNGPQFTNTIEAIAERFHMSQDLLKALNPGANFGAAGTHIIVVDDAAPAFAKGDVARLDVTKSDASARAYDKSGTLVAFYPATVGSTERPSPSGIHKVVGVAFNPDYTYDPAKLHWGPRSAGKLVIKPGPNNPVGAVWIDLNAPGYGVHGTPDPDKIGKTASHGCVRLTNWDAQALAHGVKPGVVVRFLGERGGAKS